MSEAHPRFAAAHGPRRASPLVLARALAALALLATAPALAAQSYTVVDSARLPAESFVGDAVELRYTLRTDEQLSAPSPPPEAPWGTIESVSVSEGNGQYSVRIVVVPYEPGTLTLPRIDLGGVALAGLSVSVTSVLEPETELRTIYGPQRLPGTRLAIFLIVLIVVVPGGAALYLAGPGRTLINSFVARHRARIPYRNLMRTIDRLESNIRYETSREFYTKLVASIQDLMTNRLEFECRAATSTELEAYLPLLAARCGEQAEAVSELADIFRAADRAKFGHAQIRRKVRLAHLDLCREAMARLEAARKRAQRGHRKQEVDRVGG
ncbi:MAG: hypothetical protein ACOCW3_04900 [Spirochaetota bacterium]